MGIILKWTFKNFNESMDWVNRSQDRDTRRALVNEGMSLRFPQNEGDFLSS